MPYFSSEVTSWSVIQEVAGLNGTLITNILSQNSGNSVNIFEKNSIVLACAVHSKHICNVLNESQHPVFIKGNQKGESVLSHVSHSRKSVVLLFSLPQIS